jgi:hypothetical protein
LQLYADGGYQLRIRSLEGTPNYGPRQYLRTIMMVLASVAATSFIILLIFSLHSCLRLCAMHSRQRAWEQAPPPRIRLTPALTRTHVVVINKL